MASTLEMLDARLTEVEHQLAKVQATVGVASADESDAAARGRRSLELARASQASIARSWRALLDQLGISGPPIDPLELQRQHLATAVGGQTAAAEIVAMREE